MTKENEIKILNECIKKLGKNSYCGTWLNEQMPYIESAIKSDVHPSYFAHSMFGAIEAAKTIRKNAEDESARLTASTRLEVERIISAGEEKAGKMLDRVMTNLIRIRDDINNTINY